MLLPSLLVLIKLKFVNKKIKLTRVKSENFKKLDNDQVLNLKPKCVIMCYSYIFFNRHTYFKIASNLANIELSISTFPGKKKASLPVNEGANLM